MVVSISKKGLVKPNPYALQEAKPCCLIFRGNPYVLSNSKTVYLMYTWFPDKRYKSNKIPIMRQDTKNLIQADTRT